MSGPRIALVGRDPQIRLELARAFDDAPPAWTVALFESPPADADVVVLGGDVEGPGIEHVAGRPDETLKRVCSELERRRMGRAFAVTAAGGGCGTTTVALHLAAALGARRSVCYVELDPNEGGAVRLGLEPRKDPLAAPLPVPGGFRALLAGTRTAKCLERATSEFERVVVDLGSHADPKVLGRAAACVLVVNPTVTAAQRARSLLDAHPELDWAVVVNRIGPGSRLTTPMLSSILEHAVAVELPCCPRLRDAEDEGRLFTSGWSRWYRRIDRLAETLDAR